MEKQGGYRVTKIAGASPVAPCLVIRASDVRGDTEEVQRIGIRGKVMQASACVGADKRVGVERCGISPVWVHPRRLAQCRDLGLARVLLTCAADNEPSRRVILANGGNAGRPDSRRIPVLDQPRQQPPSISPRPPREPTHQGELLLIRQKAPSWQQVGRVRANARVQAGTSEAAGALT